MFDMNSFLSNKLGLKSIINKEKWNGIIKKLN